MSPICVMHRDHLPCTYSGNPGKPQCSGLALGTLLLFCLGSDSCLPVRLLSNTLRPDKASGTAQLFHVAG